MVQFADTDVNISVNMRRQVPTERKSVEGTQRRDRLGARNGTFTFKPIQFIDREGSSSTVILQKQVLMIQKVQANRCLV